jgi:hypothetical protein
MFFADDVVLVCESGNELIGNWSCGERV